MFAAFRATNNGGSSPMPSKEECRDDVAQADASSLWDLRSRAIFSTRVSLANSLFSVSPVRSMSNFLAISPSALRMLVSFLFSQQIDLKVEVISPLGLKVHGVLPNQDERRQEHGFKCENGRQERKRIGIESSCGAGVPYKPEHD
jgi:hypothetical protein